MLRELPVPAEQRPDACAHPGFRLLLRQLAEHLSRRPININNVVIVVGQHNAVLHILEDFILGQRI